MKGRFITFNLVNNVDKPNSLNPLVLAFLGDAVFELLVRGNIVSSKSTNVNNMNQSKVKYVCSEGQARAFKIVENHLTEEEYIIYKRGRNTNGNNIPKNSNMINYRIATGIEALFGYLYLKKDISRINELFFIIWNELNILKLED